MERLTAARPQRGYLYFAALRLSDGDERRKRVAVVSANRINHPKGLVVVARVTANPARAALPTAVELEPDGETHLRETSWILCHDLYTIHAGKLDELPFGSLSTPKKAEVDQKLRFALDL